MALNRFVTRPTSNFFNGFDDFFAPSPFMRDPFFDDFMPMPVIARNFDRDQQGTIRRSSPGYEINETKDKYSISIDVPGVKPSDMSIELQDDGQVLHLSGGRKIKKGDQETETKFSQRFTIGKNVDTTKLSADLSDGVLTVTAPKKEKPEPVKIAITEGKAKL